jgi:outer membrane receptor protein involved in Fe transport
LAFSLNQLIGRDLSLGARYRLIDADLVDNFPTVPHDNIALDNFNPKTDVESVLHQLSLDALYNHPKGLFARFQALWNLQNNHGYEPERPGDDFWQFNVYAGYRFPGRKAQVMLGLLNLTDRDYRLEPLTLYQELPRERTLVVQLQLDF